MAAVTERQFEAEPDLERIGGLTYQFFAAQRVDQGKMVLSDAREVLRDLAKIARVDEQTLGDVLNRVEIAVMGLGDNERALRFFENKMTGSVGIDWLTKEAARQVWRAR